MIRCSEFLRTRFGAGILMFLLLSSFSLKADEFRPALLEINERDGGWIDVTWKVPMMGEQVLALTPVLPEFLEQMGPGSSQKVPGAWLETRSYRAGQNTLNGVTLKVEGLIGVPIDVLVRVNLADGGRHSAILRSTSNSFTVPEQVTRMELAVSYWRMGTIHILEGYDHLLFLLTLLLIVAGFWPLLKTITAFTLAHSITLALATLGVVHIPPVPTEAVISLSIVLLAVEVVHKNQGLFTLSEQFPWVVAFTFGLVHGLGFAGALSEIGVPQNEVPLALLMFNVGVETGQIMFVTVVSALLAGVHRLHSQSALTVERAAPYAIGGIASFWTLQRLVGTFSG
jgi:hypothetical protein